MIEQDLDKARCPECDEPLFDADRNNVRRHKSDGTPECGSTWEDK